MFLKLLVNKLRYLAWVSPIVWLTLLNGCGTGTVLNPFIPGRIIAFGDAFMDVRAPRFTVNDEIPNNVDPTHIVDHTQGYLTASTVLVTQFQNSTGAGGVSSSNYYNYTFNGNFGLEGYLKGAPNPDPVPGYTPLSVYNEYAPIGIDTGTPTSHALNTQLTLIERLASDYGFGSVIPMSTIANHVVPSDTGVYSFGQANALVKNLTPGSDVPQSYPARFSYNGGTITYGGSSTLALSVEAQIDFFLNANNTISATDLIVINAGTADVFYQASLDGTGAAGVTKAAKDFSDQVMRLRNAGAKHIIVFGPPNMGRSPFAWKYNLKTLLTGYTLTLNSQSCTDFNCTTELNLQEAIGTVTQNPVLFVDISSQTSLITGTTNTGTSNTYGNFADPMYAVPIAFPGDPAIPDYSGLTNISIITPTHTTSGTPATDGNYYCNSTNIPSDSAAYDNPFYITSPTISGTYPTYSIGGKACFANPVSPTSTFAANLHYSTIGANGAAQVYNYLSYAYADAVYFGPSVNRMLADFIIGKLTLASWK